MPNGAAPVVLEAADPLAGLRIGRGTRNGLSQHRPGAHPRQHEPEQAQPKA